VHVAQLVRELAAQRGGVQGDAEAAVR